MPSPPERVPGDLILDRYAPDATTEQREQGRAALLNYARALLRMGDRLYAERQDSPESPGRRRLE
jgi:hypothetical protein